MKEKKILYVFRYYQFDIGGIQTWIYDAVKQLIEKGSRILILTNAGKSINEGFNDAFENELVTIADFSSEGRWDYGVYTCIKYYVFTVEGMARAFAIKRKYSDIRFDVFYCVPNFKGADYFYDDQFGARYNRFINRRLSSVFRKMNDANQIRYFSKSHYDVMREKYRYAGLDFPFVSVPMVRRADPFNEAKRREIWERKEFRIITVSRFDFPHKAYIIGLIDAFEAISKEYPNVTLQIVGYGHSLNEIMTRIERMDDSARDSISIIGETPFNELPALFEQSNLNISLAGCCKIGARCGVLSIPARHFSYSGEVYGFLPGSLSMITSDAKGYPVKPYIERVINMPEDEYVEWCRKGYEALMATNISTSFDDSNSSDYCLPIKDIRLLLIIHFLIKHYIPLKQRVSRALHGELFSMIKKIMK